MELPCICRQLKLQTHKTEFAATFRLQHILIDVTQGIVLQNETKIVDKKEI